MGFGLEKFYLITPDFLGKKLLFLRSLAASLNNGINLIQFRSKNLPALEYEKMAKEVVQLAHSHGAKVLLNGSVTLLDLIDADGIHLPSRQHMLEVERPISAQHLLSLACHDAAQVQSAQRMGADLITLSPVFATPSSPQGRPLGWEEFSLLAKGADMPVFALGGLSQKDLSKAQEMGAHGIAAKRAFWNVGAQIV